LRSAIFLEPDFIMAHVALAGVLQAQQRATETRRHIDVARQLLRNCDPLRPVPQAQGLLGGQVLRMLESMQGRSDA
jgi:chemotaxis protein methyltransferase CheR